MVVMVHQKHKYPASIGCVTVLISATLTEFYIPQRLLLRLETLWCKIHKLLFPLQKTAV